jgi:hypothetical protein
MPRVVAYTYDAAMHCPCCTGTHAALGILKRVPPLQMGTDEHGIAFDLIDREGNQVRPVFSTDENWQGEACDDCTETIE